MAELDALDPISDEITLESGLTIELERLRARQFFKLLRIVTGSGALGQFANAGLFQLEGKTESEFTMQFVTVVLMSIPDAEEETIQFIRSMAKPAGLREGRKLNKQDDTHNTELWLAFDEQLDNPELEDLVTIIEAIVRREAGDIQALGKRLASMFKLAEKTGQIPESTSPNQKESTEESSEGSPVASISSRRNTSGRTTTSATSRSRGSASASRRSKSAASTSAGNESNG